MISVEKLKKLPRHQRLHKSLKIISLAEKKLLLEGRTGLLATDLTGITEMLAADPEFPLTIRGALENAGKELKRDDETLRCLNNIKHILTTATGKSTADWDLIDHSGKLDPLARHIFSGMHIFLEDLRSPFNVGSIFRSAESFGVEKILLSSISADPGHARARRSAMGCVDLVSWEKRDLKTLEEYIAASYPVFAMETGGTPLGKFKFPGKGIMLIGSEELGLSPTALSMADSSWGRLSISTLGAKGSLNVSVAAGITLQAWSASILNTNL